MPDKLRDAIRSLRNLSFEQQQILARDILDRAAQDEEWTLSDEQIADVQRRAGNPRRRLFSISETRR